jgi:DNA-binding Lrp family transcriptional regulator
MSTKLDEKDLAILQLIQENSKLTANQTEPSSTQKN